MTSNSLTFYTADTPNGQKISIFLREARLSYEQVNLNLSKGQQREPAFLKLNPNGKIPVIVDHEAGITLAESGAILTYLASKHGLLWPKDYREQAVINQWLQFQMGAIGPMLGQLWWFTHGSKTGNTEAIHRYHNETHRLYGVVDRQLGAWPYLAGDQYTIADIAAFPWLRTYDELGIDPTPYSNVQRWLDSIEKRGAVRDGLAAVKAG
ncbi:glutathione S-transferase family protein [Burkholderia plantarii]|uniref:Glutathione S-transferase-like protein n=1 Tax=Burkholderia plantarii TaxID=41899 RepID=A0A0B6RQH1_BURPL|nr:glutathione S-transferase N-terminal domain-containing protein [Burkholderia plantarii]AJK45628.1 glutathione S-transferase-like protein [Burkholderia plantarii]ALK29880.1 Glutathione S-transferase-like protein [Burkholderia plantarii]WLE58628.1 glutathione S-transferase N-terminal domain-containing protein [Burkholderia plantarii]GLZ20799.1 thiol:disulfide oxidoreductase [Burkholderia plantarii]